MSAFGSSTRFWPYTHLLVSNRSFPLHRWRPSVSRSIALHTFLFLYGSRLSQLCSGPVYVRYVYYLSPGFVAECGRFAVMILASRISYFPSSFPFLAPRPSRPSPSGGPSSLRRSLLRLWCYCTLGRHFAFELVIQPGHGARPDRDKPM